KNKRLACREQRTINVVNVSIKICERCEISQVIGKAAHRLKRCDKTSVQLRCNLFTEAPRARQVFLIHLVFRRSVCYAYTHDAYDYKWQEESQIQEQLNTRREI